MQTSRYSTPVYSAQASFEERAKLVNGQSVTRPTVARMYEQDYTRGSDMTMQTLAESNETLTVQTAKATPFPLDDLDVVQSNFKLMGEYSSRAMRALNKAVDADYLGEVANATSSVDASDVGGTAGAGIVLDSSNVLSMFAAANRKLENRDIFLQGGLDPRSDAGNMKPMGGAGFANLAPHVKEKLGVSLAGRETVYGDMVGKNGYCNSYFGFDNYVTTNGYWTGLLTMATNPTDGDTIVINGVTTTFKDTLTTASGSSEVHIASTADITRANLVKFLNAPTTSEAEATDTGYSSMSTENANLLKRMTFTNDNSANTMAVVAKGYSYVVTSETLTAAADVWSLEISHQMFGQKGAVDMVVQVKPTVAVSDIPLQLGKYVKPYVLYGKKTFTEGADALVDVKIDSSSWV